MVRVVEVEAVARAPGLDAQDLRGGLGHDGDVEGAPHALGVLGGADDVDAQVGGDEQHVGAPELRRAVGELGADLAAHGARRLRADEGEQRLLERALVQLGLPAHRAAAQVVEQRLERHPLGVDPQLGAGVEHAQVGQHLALVGQQGGVAAGAGRERLDVVRDLAGEQLLGLRPGQRELAALGTVDEGDLLGQQAVGGCGLGDGGGHPSRVVQRRLTLDLGVP